MCVCVCVSQAMRAAGTEPFPPLFVEGKEEGGEVRLLGWLLGYIVTEVFVDCVELELSRYVVGCVM